MSTKSDPRIAFGWTWAAGDRYDQAVCEANPLAQRLAACLEESEYHQVPKWVAETMRARSMYWYEKIPVPVYFCTQEPYSNLKDMQDDVLGRNERKEKCLRVRGHKIGKVLGQGTQFWRAAHDYYGHCLMDAPFTLSGELESFAQHMRQFPRACWPYIRSNVVLENAYRLNRGHFLCWPKGLPACPAKVVFDEDFFGRQEDWYSKASMEG